MSELVQHGPLGHRAQIPFPHESEGPSYGQKNQNLALCPLTFPKNPNM